jgi:hypothetical protein
MLFLELNKSLVVLVLLVHEVFEVEVFYFINNIGCLVAGFLDGL